MKPKPTKPPDRTNEFAKLAEVHARAGLQFVATELQAFRTAREVGEFELASGDRSVAAKEVASADKMVMVIRRFRAKLPAEDKPELTATLTEVKTRLEALRVWSKAKTTNDVTTIRQMAIEAILSSFASVLVTTLD